MPKIRINEIQGRPATPGVALDGGAVLVPGETADIPDWAPFQHLVDNGLIVTVAGRPKKAPANETDPD